MKHTRPQLKLSLRKRTLTCCRLNKEGVPEGKSDKWKITKNSNVPCALFYLILGFVRKGLSTLAEADFETRKDAVVRALRQAARATGCKPIFGCKGTDIAWRVDGKRLIGFQIHEKKIDESRREELLRCKTRLRWIITVNGRSFRFRLQRTRQKKYSGGMPSEDSSTS